MVPPLTFEEKRMIRNKRNSRIGIIRDYRTRTGVSLDIAFRVCESYSEGWTEAVSILKSKEPR